MDLLVKSEIDEDVCFFTTDSEHSFVLNKRNYGGMLMIDFNVDLMEID